jgi:hypothetical protein
MPHIGSGAATRSEQEDMMRQAAISTTMSIYG